MFTLSGVYLSHNQRHQKICDMECLYAEPISSNRCCDYSLRGYSAKPSASNRYIIDFVWEELRLRDYVLPLPSD